MIIFNLINLIMNIINKLTNKREYSCVRRPWGDFNLFSFYTGFQTGQIYENFEM